MVYDGQDDDDDDDHDGQANDIDFILFFRRSDGRGGVDGGRQR